MKKCNFKTTTKMNIPIGDGLYEIKDIYCCDLKTHGYTPPSIDTCDGEPNCVLFQSFNELNRIREENETKQKKEA